MHCFWILRRRAFWVCTLLVCLGFGFAAHTFAYAQSPLREPLQAIVPSRKAAAITFDADMDADDVPALLQALHEKNVHATFFVTGVWAEKYPQALRQIAQAGHEIGCHGDLHRDLTALTAEQQRQDLAANCEKIRAACGAEAAWLRPPYRRWNSTLLQSAHAQGLRVADCSAVTDDWKNAAPQIVCAQALDRLKSGGILLLHCSGLNTATALPRILAALQSRGFALGTVSQLAETACVSGRKRLVSFTFLCRKFG
ncbi:MULTISPECIES: polysaccharide deacetylase family protein [Caproicibacterium]|uniref:Polysaccharide deacetylase family protein n=1 Tax=Caproicibacterium argilliputei TaxID=3030016 RepID=A0AA97D690_9FIRM|nr:polysaccharide deacetylase family protein [Caproicibacterium argilliputei]WOC31340.1 polysaccharide deacetylase family protein [Caproicibacterium argilliputei]